MVYACEGYTKITRMIAEATKAMITENTQFDRDIIQVDKFKAK